MGNCMFCSYEEERVRVIVFGGGEMELKATTPAKKIVSGQYRGYKLVQHNQPYSPLSPEAKLQPGGAYYLVPHLIYPKLVNGKGQKPRMVRIVITRKQMELLKQRAMKKQSKAKPVGAVQPRRRRRKWQPSLSVIPEMQSC